MHMICPSMPILALTELTKFLHISCRKKIPHPFSAPPSVGARGICSLPLYPPPLHWPYNFLGYASSVAPILCSLKSVHHTLIRRLTDQTDLIKIRDERVYLPQNKKENVQNHCCQWYGVVLEDLWVVSLTYISKAVEARYDISQISAVCAILELVFIRSGCFEFSDTSNGTCISACKINACIQFLCAS